MKNYFIRKDNHWSVPEHVKKLLSEPINRGRKSYKEYLKAANIKIPKVKWDREPRAKAEDTLE